MILKSALKTSTSSNSQSTSNTTQTITLKTFKQTNPSDSWVIPHNLGRRPSIKTYTVNGVVELFGEVTHPSINVSNVLFDTPVAGIAEYN